MTNTPNDMPSDTGFRPFETHLDRDAALSRVKAAVAGADDGELFMERRRSEVLAFDDGRVKTASFDASEGFGLRAVRGEGPAKPNPSSAVRTGPVCKITVPLRRIIKEREKLNTRVAHSLS